MRRLLLFALAVIAGASTGVLGQDGPARPPSSPETSSEAEREMQALDRAIEKDPSDARVHAWRGNARAARGDLDGAIDDYNRALTIHPEYAYAYARRGAVWMKKHETGRAITDYTEAIRLDPTDRSSYLGRGDAWSRQGDHAPALADYDEAIRLDPGAAVGYIARALEWEKDLKPELALADYQRAIALDPRSVVAYEGRGRIWRKAGEYEKAIANFAELIRLVPDDPRGHRALAWMLATCDRDDIRDGRRALAEARTACALTRWAAPETLEAFAAACAEIGDFDAAVDWQARALELFTARQDRADRRLIAVKRQDADMSHRLYRYKKRLTYRERSDRAVR